MVEIQHVTPKILNSKYIHPKNVRYIKEEMEHLLSRLPEEIHHTDIPWKIQHIVPHGIFNDVMHVSPVRDVGNGHISNIYHEDDDLHVPIYGQADIDWTNTRRSKRNALLNHLAISALTNHATKLLTGQSKGGESYYEALLEMLHNPDLTFSGHISKLTDQAKKEYAHNRKDVEDKITKLLMMSDRPDLKLTPGYIEFLHRRIPNSAIVSHIEEPFERKRVNSPFGTLENEFSPIEVREHVDNEPMTHNIFGHKNG